MPAPFRLCFSMRNILCGIAVISLAGAGLGAGAQAPTSRAGLASDLERLTVPAAALPANCKPRAPGGMFDANPAVVTDPRILGPMHALIFGAGSGDAAAPGRASPSDARSQGAEVLAARAADVEIGYAAAYEEQGGSPEIGVFALRMKKMPVSDGATTGSPSSGRIIRGSVAIFYWSDATASAHYRGCLDVVRQHIGSVEFR
jgi:hypothetical protein